MLMMMFITTFAARRSLSAVARSGTLAVKREWNKIIVSDSERVMVQNEFRGLQLYRDQVRTNSDYSICTV